MRKPNPNELIVCPDSRTSTKKLPESVFDTIDPNGNKVSFGVIGKHKHGFYLTKECRWGGLVVRIVTAERYVI